MPVNPSTESPGFGPFLLPSVILSALVGFAFALIITQGPKKAILPTDLSPIVAELDKIRESIAQLQASRCMTVNTPILQMSVYSTPNIGTKPLPTYDKSVEKGK